MIALQIVVLSRDPGGDSPQTRQAQGLFPLVIIAPLLAGWVAWVSGAFRSDLERRASVRSRLARSMPLALLPLAATFAAQSVLIVVSGTWPEPRLLLWWLSLLLAAALTGLAAGVTARRVIASPLAALLWWALLAWSAATPWATVRALAGVPTLVVCCASGDAIDPAALHASTVFYGGVIVAALLIVAGGVGWLALMGLVGGVAGLGLVAGVLLARGLDVNPFVPRDDPVSCSAEFGRDLCAWPEHLGERAVYGEAVEREARGLESLALVVPTVWSERCHDGTVGCISMSPGASPSVRRGAVVYAVLRANGFPADDPVTTAAVLRILGEPVEDLRGQLLGSELDDFNATVGLGPGALSRWLPERPSDEP